MCVGIISVFTDYLRRGRHPRGAMQPLIGPLITALPSARLPAERIAPPPTAPGSAG
jgi:hypothetical protein